MDVCEVQDVWSVVQTRAGWLVPRDISGDASTHIVDPKDAGDSRHHCAIISGRISIQDQLQPKLTQQNVSHLPMIFHVLVGRHWLSPDRTIEDGKAAWDVADLPDKGPICCKHHTFHAALQ
jgi:hypothetical protein